MWWFGSINTVTPAPPFFPSHSCIDDVAPYLVVFVWMRGNEASSVCERVCPQSGHMDGLQPAWLRLLPPLHHLLDHSRCHVGTSEKSNRNTHNTVFHVYCTNMVLFILVFNIEEWSVCFHQNTPTQTPRGNWVWLLSHCQKYLCQAPHYNTTVHVCLERCTDRAVEVGHLSMVQENIKRNK